MKLKILGAAGEVTGSNYLIETRGYKVLFDCGFYQGKDEQKHDGRVFDFNPADIDALFLTHAHIDHCGRIPLLVKMGFKGKIYCTFATSDLVDIMWHDSAHLMTEEATWRSRKNLRRGLPGVEPLYRVEDVQAAIDLKCPINYDEVMEILPGLKVRYRDAGHILGSSIIEAWVKEPGEERSVKVVFSGDLGPALGAIEKPPSIIEEADFVVIESTYGDRLHKSLTDTRSEFQSVMEQAISTASKVLIPTFVIDRAQRVLYEFVLLQKKLGAGCKMPDIYLDSPMGVRATEIYKKYSSLLSKELKDSFNAGEDPFAPEGFSFIRTPEESKEINARQSGIVMAGSGMATGGRIVHHLKHNIYKPDTHVIFVGYQAHGTLGRRLVDGATDVRIAGEDVQVKAQLHTLNGFSAHADRQDLLAWSAHLPKKTRFVVVHGEIKSAEALATGLRDQGYSAHVPSLREEIDLLMPVHESRKMPLLSPGLLKRLGVTDHDIQQMLYSIMDRADTLQKQGISDEDYASVLPLLASARTLLDTAGMISEKKTEEITV